MYVGDNSATFLKQFQNSYKFFVFIFYFFTFIFKASSLFLLNTISCCWLLKKIQGIFLIPVMKTAE